MATRSNVKESERVDSLFCVVTETVCMADLNSQAKISFRYSVFEKLSFFTSTLLLVASGFFFYSGISNSILVLLLSIALMVVAKKAKNQVDFFANFRDLCYFIADKREFKDSDYADVRVRVNRCLSSFTSNKTPGLGLWLKVFFLVALALYMIMKVMGKQYFESFMSHWYDLTKIDALTSEVLFDMGVLVVICALYVVLFALFNRKYRYISIEVTNKLKAYINKFG